MTGEKLTKKEQALLDLIEGARGRLITNEEIDEALWPDHPNPQSNRHELIHRLRGKLPDLDIETSHWQGIKGPRDEEE